jgi:hypothetical protein
MALLRVTEDFVHHHRNLRERTGNNPSGARRALDKFPDLAYSIGRLREIYEQLNRHRRFGARRFVVQAHPEFQRAFKDYRDRWRRELQRMLNEDPGLGLKDIEPIEIDLGAPEEVTTPVETGSEGFGWEERWQFDPERDKLTEMLHWLQSVVRGTALDDWDDRAVEAVDWLEHSVGLDFDDIQRRWIEFPVIVVPQHVSDKYGPDQPRGLYGGLNQIRQAYIVGADFAAIAMCRAVTDLLIRDHYNNGAEGDLTPLIRRTEEKPRFAFLRRFNLTAKVREANDILHQIGRENIGHKNPHGSLVTGWVRDLQEVIDRAPKL